MTRDAKKKGVHGEVASPKATSLVSPMLNSASYPVIFSLG